MTPRRSLDLAVAVLLGAAVAVVVRSQRCVGGSASSVCQGAITCPMNLLASCPRCDGVESDLRLAADLLARYGPVLEGSPTGEALLESRLKQAVGMTMTRGARP